MDEQVVRFVKEVAQTIVGLDVALFYQANPRTFDTAAGIALRTHRDVEDITQALQRMAEHGYLETFSRGEGRYTCYALPRHQRAWNLLCKLSEAYLDHPNSRKEIIKLLMHREPQSEVANGVKKGQEHG